jgi:hypothetical protein
VEPRRTTQDFIKCAARHDLEAPRNSKPRRIDWGSAARPTPHTLPVSMRQGQENHSAHRSGSGFAIAQHGLWIADAISTSRRSAWFDRV